MIYNKHSKDGHLNTEFVYPIACNLNTVFVKVIILCFSILFILRAAWFAARAGV